MNGDFMEAINQICKDKGIQKEILLEAIESALVSAYKKNFGSAPNAKVVINPETGDVKVFSLKKVVESPQNGLVEIGIEEAKKISPKYKIGDTIEVEVTPKNFGRIAAQNAKQVVIQRIREAERGLIYEKFIEMEDELVNGYIQRVEKRNVYIDLNDAEAILPPGEQMPNEEYHVNERIKVYISEVKKTSKGPQITVSRTHPGLVKRLFELEVPEIANGDVIIKSISREAGSRTKIAVHANDPNIDPIGSCVGPKGIRVQNIVDELKDEKIDIIKWSEDPKDYIASALSPAKVLSVMINLEEKSARVVVPDNQLSLAIGKKGQNVRLAARLTGWKIDIKSDSQVEIKFEDIENFGNDLGDMP